MCKKYFYLLCLLNFLLIPTDKIFGQTTWYVNKSAIGSNNGSSLANAWKSFSAISWSSIKSGDNIIISDGVYNEQLKISNGQQNITISGTSNAILDGQNNIDDGIYIDGKTNPVDHITIKNLTFRNYNWAGIYSDGEYSGRVSNITIDHCVFYNNIRSCVFFEGGGNVANNYNMVIRNCNMNTPDNNSAQTDLIYTQYINDVTVDNCYLIVDNISNVGHNDCFQAYWVDNCTLTNNTAIQNNGNTTETQCLFVEEGNGIQIFYNNVIYDDCNGNASDAKLFFKHNTNSPGHSIFLNNTIYAHGGGMIQTGDPNSVIKNNILYCTGRATVGTTTTDMVRFDHGKSSSADVDYNLYYDPSNTMGTATGGKGPHSIEANPLFVNIGSPTSFDLSVKANSPAINSGENLISFLTIDITRKPRPVSGAWDMGSYEIDGTVSGVSSNNAVPNSFALSQNYPNPFNPSTTIEYTLPKSSNIQIKVYDATGKEVKTLVNEYQQNGSYKINFNADILSSGVYFYRLIADNFSQTKKMMVIK